MTDTLHEDQYTFLIISRSVCLRMRNVSDKSCRQNQNTRIMFNNFFLFFENRAVYEIIWKNIVQPDRPHITIWHMRIACWIPKGHKHTLRICNTCCFFTATIISRRASMLRYSSIVCIVIHNIAPRKVVIMWNLFCMHIYIGFIMNCMFFLSPVCGLFTFDGRHVR